MFSNSFLSAISWLSIILFASAAPARWGSSPTATNVETIYQFPNGTWVENLAVRKDGGILLTSVSSPQLFHIDPFTKDAKPTIVHSFPAPATAVVGIVELEVDNFYVTTMNFSFRTFTAVPGSVQVWRVDLCEGPSAAKVSLLTNLTSSFLPNGLAAIPSSQKLLVAETLQGLVWRVDAQSGAVDVAAKHPMLYSARDENFGVNGLRMSGDGFLHFTNTGNAIYGKIPMSLDGIMAGDPLLLFQNNATAPDDMSLYPRGGCNAAFLADGTNDRIIYTTGYGNNFTTIATVGGPTSAAMGRRSGDHKSLYVTSAGHELSYQQFPVPVAGRLTKITLKD